MQWMKGGGWPFQSNPSIAKELVTFQYGDFIKVGEEKQSHFPTLLIGVKKAICRKSLILHAYWSSSLSI